MSDDALATAKARRTSIYDLAALGVELPEEHLRLAAGAGPHSIGGKFSMEGGGFDGQLTYTFRF